MSSVFSTSGSITYTLPTSGGNTLYAVYTYDSDDQYAILSGKPGYKVASSGSTLTITASGNKCVVVYWKC